MSVVKEFNWSEFGIGVAEAAIGALIGFLFGLVAFHYQQRKAASQQRDAQRRAATDALNRLMLSSVANIEALANAKLQLLDDLRKDLDEMRHAIDRYLSGITEVDKLVEVSASLDHFFQTLPTISFMELPAFREFSELSAEMPSLSTFAHRGITMIHEVNARLVERNAFIDRHVSESTGSGLPVPRVMYYFKMLLDQGDHICETVDYGLYFFSMVLEQIDEYRNSPDLSGKLIAYTIVPMAKDAIPTEDMFPELRKQIVRFRKKG